MKTNQRKIRERRMGERRRARVRVIREAVREVRGWLEAMKALIPLGAPRA